MKRNLKIFLICLGIITSSNSNAQIIYTDIPDTIISYPEIPYLGYDYVYYYLDINNDSIYDFYFELEKWQEWATPSSQPIYYVSQIRFIQENKTCVFEDDSYDCTYVYDIDDIIDTNSNWEDYTASLVFLNYAFGGRSCSLPFQDKYYGIKLIIDNNTHYGWLHLNANESGEIMLKGYAFNTIPNQQIKAGQTEPDAINTELPEDQVVITCINKCLNIRQNNTNKLIKQVGIHDLTGKTIYDFSANDYQITLDLHNVKTGMYIVRIGINEKVHSKLLYVN